MSETITTLDARRIASEWHDGQASALYAFGSSGTIISGFLGEVRRACAMAETQKQMGQLDAEAYWEMQDLLAFAEYYSDSRYSDMPVS